MFVKAGIESGSWIATQKTSTQLTRYLDVTTRRKLLALSCNKKFVGINKIPVNTVSAEIQGF
jgi:hypothetical protein